LGKIFLSFRIEGTSVGTAFMVSSSTVDVVVNVVVDVSEIAVRVIFKATTVSVSGKFCLQDELID
jgi:hypothetical protein